MRQLGRAGCRSSLTSGPIFKLSHISNFSNWNSVKCQNRNGRHVFEVEIMPKLLFKKKETTLSVKTSAWAIDQVIRTNNQSLEITKSEKR